MQYPAASRMQGIYSIPLSHTRSPVHYWRSSEEREAEPERSQGRTQTAVVERRNVHSCPVLLCSCCLRCACSSLLRAVPAVSSIPGWLRPWCWCCEPCWPASAPCSPWTCCLGWNPLCPWRTSTPSARTRGTPRPSLRTTEAPGSWRSLLLSPSLETGTQDSMWVQSSVCVCVYVFICMCVHALGSWQLKLTWCGLYKSLRELRFGAQPNTTLLCTLRVCICLCALTRAGV